MRLPVLMGVTSLIRPAIGVSDATFACSSAHRELACHPRATATLSAQSSLTRRSVELPLSDAKHVCSRCYGRHRCVTLGTLSKQPSIPVVAMARDVLRCPPGGCRELALPVVRLLLPSDPRFERPRRMSDRVSLVLTVNGARRELAVEPRRTLLDALREDLLLTGAKPGCNMGQCGACTVLLDGEAIYSCLTLAVECEGHHITTIEGLSHGAELDPVQRAFIEHDALQCGFCTPGQVLTMKAFLARDPHPSDDAILTAMSGNLCRCGAYAKILAAGRSLAREG